MAELRVVGELKVLAIVGILHVPITKACFPDPWEPHLSARHHEAPSDQVVSPESGMGRTVGRPHI